MNGRIYDPKLGRFLQADPIVQAPKNSQSLNRYTYVLNNPLSYTDPSGYYGLEGFIVASVISSFINFIAHKIDTAPSNEIEQSKSFDDLVPGTVAGAFGSTATTVAPPDVLTSTDVITAMLGGTASDQTGQKFANGALSETFYGMFGRGARSPSPDSRVTVKTSVNESTGEHEYSIRGVICSQSSISCNEALADRVFEHVNKNDIPFTDNDLGGGDRTLLPGIPGTKIKSQRIRHSEDVLNRRSSNRALPGHIFFPGDVDHNVRFENGELIYEVLGTGVGENPVFNNFADVFIFRHEVIKTVEKFGDK